MLLAVDVGNTNVVMGLFDEAGQSAGTLRVGTRRDATTGEIAMAVAHLCRDLPGRERAIRRTVLCSVVPPLTRTFAMYVTTELGHEPGLVSAEIDLGVPVAVDDPREVGADRIANALAAREKFGWPTIVVDLGTATNFDVLDREGRYVGGVIAPGVETSAEDLFRRAARLTKVDFTFPDRSIGRNTRDCLRAGIMLGAVGMIDSLVDRIWEELGAQGTSVATGGLAPLIAPKCRTIDRVETSLTLEGLLFADRVLMKRALKG
jgi:type III pantothenate kinase